MLENYDTLDSSRLRPIDPVPMLFEQNVNPCYGCSVPMLPEVSLPMEASAQDLSSAIMNGKYVGDGNKCSTCDSGAVIINVRAVYRQTGPMVAKRIEMFRTDLIGFG
jgi:hypothetical protein